MPQIAREFIYELVDGHKDGHLECTDEPIIRCADCENCQIRNMPGHNGEELVYHPFYFCLGWDSRHEFQTEPNGFCFKGISK